ncbi:MAG: o-succinylbenzoate synthase [Crocinitomicaceae bacterium]|nr:o-succinylbenzoate synthase [Crocinitomicaceae bacterium]
MKLNYYKKTLNFKKPAGTSRGILEEKPSWILFFDEAPLLRGECSIIPGLSPDYVDDEQYENKVKWVCEIYNGLDKHDSITSLSFFSTELQAYPSILFGIETLIYNLNLSKGIDSFESSFSKGQHGIPINGLIWMGSVDQMITQLEDKIKEGYKIVKLKIGAISFKKELSILKFIREKYAQEIEVRVDANGAYEEPEVKEILNHLKNLGVHSIEQPIAKGNWELMNALCKDRVIPIALDEELIGVTNEHDKKELLSLINPQFIILKPSLHGGIKGCSEWIELAESQGVGWWLTSALESNIGLEMIARFAAHFKPNIAQGLGTGGLFTNNFPSRLFISKGYLFLGDEEK